MPFEMIWARLPKDGLKIIEEAENRNWYGRTWGLRSYEVYKIESEI